MHEWDIQDNFSSPRGLFTIYSPNYDEDMEESIMGYDCTGTYYLEALESELEQSLSNLIEDGEEDEYNLIGINSNSFKMQHKHNIFLEWDTSHYIPTMDTLKEIGGTIVRTGGGLHILKEADISLMELSVLQNKYNCCPGFVEYTLRKGHSCLRVCPKGDNNNLEIIELENSFLSEVYVKIIMKLKGVYDGLVR